MLNSGKNKYSNVHVVRKKNPEGNHKPPCKLNGRFLRLNKKKLEEPVKKMTLHLVSLIPVRQKVKLIKQLLVVRCIL
jgi:hypothetical protein